MDGMRTAADAAEIGRSLEPSRGSARTESSVSPASWTSPFAVAWIKRAMDVALAAGLLIALLPFMAIIAGLILLTEGKPILVRHTRIGLHGRPFSCLKFRTMVVDADRVLEAHLAQDAAAAAEWQTCRKLRHDPRVTAIGSLLRRSSTDELPQLFNVLFGEMSLVGPRPVVQAELDTHYRGEAGDLYRAVRPGLTGLWQVSGRSDVGYGDRVRLDMQYVQRGSIALDLRILLQTPLVVLGARGAR